MRVIKRIDDLRAVVKAQKRVGNTIGFVPTMGYLHEGHLSLIRASARENDFTIMSIFVNPIQFGANEDFEKYPRDMDRDFQMAEKAGVDVVFTPEAAEMYPEGFNTYVNVQGITDILCGKSRPGHFKGVATVVTKFFNIVEPDKAYFGQKDAQQVVVIKKMARELNMNIEIISCPIVREKDGLAMSSRNIYLNAEERKAALVLSKSLLKVEGMVRNGERSKEKVLGFIIKEIMSEKAAEIEYVEILDADSLENVKRLEGKLLIALAVRFGKTRLIDNSVININRSE